VRQGGGDEMAKVILGLMVAVAAGGVVTLASGPSSMTADAPVNHPWAQHKMEFVTWNGTKWTAWIRDGAFELIPQNQRRWSRHSRPTLAYVDWQGELWQARVDGEGFSLAHRGDWNGPTERVSVIRYRDWTGDNQLRTAAQLTR
jgi:hypothetical protein